MTAQQILDEMEPLGELGYKNILLNHGATEPCFGVKIEELKKIEKRVKMNYQLALDLYQTGVHDAMYLAGLIADDARMTKEDLHNWVRQSNRALAGSTVAWVTAGSRYGRELALEWIESDQELIAAAGWATLGSLVAIKKDQELDLPEIERLLRKVQNSIHQAPNEVRKQMNGFIIATGSYVASLKNTAIEIGRKIGPVMVNVGNTACRTPFAPDYILKVEKRGSIGKKRKTAKC